MYYKILLLLYYLINQTNIQGLYLCAHVHFIVMHAFLYICFYNNFFLRFTRIIDVDPVN